MIDGKSLFPSPLLRDRGRPGTKASCLIMVIDEKTYFMVPFLSPQCSYVLIVELRTPPGPLSHTVCSSVSTARLSIVLLESTSPSSGETML